MFFIFNGKFVESIISIKELVIKNFFLFTVLVLFFPLSIIIFLISSKSKFSNSEKRILAISSSVSYFIFFFVFSMFIGVILIFSNLNTRTEIDSNGNKVEYLTFKTDDELSKEKAIREEEEKKKQNRMKEEKKKQNELEIKKNENSPVVTIHDLENKNSTYKDKYVKVAVIINKIENTKIAYLAKADEDLEIGKDVVLNFSDKQKPNIKKGDVIIITGKLKGNKFGLSHSITIEDVIVRSKGENARKLYLDSKEKVLNSDLKLFKKDKKNFENLNKKYIEQNENILEVLSVLRANNSYQNQLDSIYIFSRISDSFSNLSSTYSNYYINDNYSNSFNKIIDSHRYNMREACMYFSELAKLMSRVNYSSFEFDEIHQKALYHQELARKSLKDLNTLLKTKENK